MGVNDTTSREKHEIETQEPIENAGVSGNQPNGIKKRSRKRSIIIFTVVSILNVALLVLLWTQLLTPSQQAQNNSGSSAATTLGDYNSPLLGKHAPNFVLSTLNTHNPTLSLANFKEKPVVLNFWASWCSPCNDEAPFLQKTVAPQLQAKGVVFIGIDAPEKASDTRTFLQKYGVSYPNVQDTLNGSTAIDYGITGFPVTVFINREGVIAGMWNAPLTAQGLKQELAKIS